MIKKIFFIWLMLVSIPVVSFSQSEAQPQTIKAVATEHMDTAKNLIQIITEFVVKYSFQVLGGLIVLLLGWIAAKYMAGFITKFLKNKHVDITVSKFIVNAAYLMIMSFAVIVALGKFGIEIAPLIAGLSVAGFGLSFALQGPLSNYASGATLIFTKPFKVGDIIEVAGVVGEVTDMKLPRTELKTVDGNTIVIPNKHIIGEIIQNYSTYKKLDLSVGVGYKSDVNKAVRIITDIIKNEPRIAQDKNCKVGISAFADSSVNLMVRVSCRQDDYWDVMFSVNKKILEEFKAQNIEIPFPQQEVYIHKDA